MTPDYIYKYFFQTASDIDKVQRHKKIEKQQVGQGSTNEDISMAFEKFVSTQKVSFFSQQMDISNYRLNFRFPLINLV